MSIPIKSKTDLSQVRFSVASAKKIEAIKVIKLPPKDLLQSYQ